MATQSPGRKPRVSDLIFALYGLIAHSTGRTLMKEQSEVCVLYTGRSPYEKLTYPISLQRSQPLPYHLRFLRLLPSPCSYILQLTLRDLKAAAQRMILLDEFRKDRVGFGPRPFLQAVPFAV